jgi:hypothetical protein
LLVVQAVGSSARLPNEPAQCNQGRCDHFLHVSRTYPAYCDSYLVVFRHYEHLADNVMSQLNR